MKNTGIKWIGEIPNSWELRKVKKCFYISKDLANESNPTVLTLARSGIKIRDISNNEGQLAASYDNYNIVKPGDLLLNPMDLYSGANCNVSEVEGVISPAYINLRKLVDLNPKYFDYFFKTQYWTMAMFAHGKGVSFDNRWTINSEALLNYWVPFPKKSVQDAIVEVINQKSFEIDSLIEIENQQIEKLQEYKQVLVIETITKGLNKSVAFIDSGVEWIGNMPSNWELIKLGSLFNVRNEKVSDKEYAPLSVSKIGVVPQIENVAKSNASDDRKLVLNGDFAINSRSDRKMSCGVADRDGSVSLINTVLYPKNRNKISANYLNYLLKNYGFAEEFYRWGHGIVADLWTTRWQEMKNILLPVPPLSEQLEIIKYIDKKMKEIDEAILLKQDKIDSIKEFQQSMIFEYVTGKKEVAV